MRGLLLKIYLVLSLFSWPCWGIEWRPHGAGPIKLEANNWSLVGAQSCKNCHTSQYREWQQSKHAQSWDNLLFQKNFKHEGNHRCLNCHVPFELQVRALEGGRIEPAKEGVTCYTCHASAHGEREITRHKSNDPKFCALCHQFNFAMDRGREVKSSSTPSQDTFREWENYRKGGGKKTCIDCHMPKKSHEFLGAYSVEFLQKGLSLRVRKKSRGCEIAIKNVGAGHRIPTGDLFRELRFEISEESNFSNSEVLRRFSRRWMQAKKGDIVGLREVANTTLAPMREEKIWIGKSNRKKLFYRLRYHYTSAHYENIFQLNEMPITIYKGEC